jgi:hypothetical protein
MDNDDFRLWLRDIATRAYYASSSSHKPFRCRGLLLIEAMGGYFWPFAFPRRGVYVGRSG